MNPEYRRAARTATLVAVPIALAIIVISLLVYGDFGIRSATPTPSPTVTEPVEMAAPGLGPDALPVCQQIVANLPAAVSGHPRRPVTAGAEQNAAYGDPPITLACGTTQPSVEPTADVYPLSGVCWYASTGPAHTAWTTIDRAIPVTVTVPGGPDGAAQSVVPFSAAIANADPVRPAAPSGCH